MKKYCKECGMPLGIHPYLNLENLPLEPAKLREKIRTDLPNIPVNEVIDIIIWFNCRFPYRQKDFASTGMYHYLSNSKEKEIIRLKIERINYEKKQTRGIGTILKGDKIIFSFKTLELPDLNNVRNISCIPIGKNTVRKRYSEKHGNHFELLDVDNRSYILIHSGNFYTDIRGCILVGSSFVDINVDGYLDVFESRKTMLTLNDILPVEFELEIV